MVFDGAVLAGMDEAGARALGFDDPGLAEALDALRPAELDLLPFGCVGMDGRNVVEVYNAHEERFSGLSRERVVGRQFFFDIAQCMNNFMVAERLEEPGQIDLVLPYVLTYRMRPTPVRLRLLRAAGAPGQRRAPRRWLLIDRG